MRKDEWAKREGKTAREAIEQGRKRDEEER